MDSVKLKWNLCERTGFQYSPTFTYKIQTITVVVCSTLSGLFHQSYPSYNLELMLKCAFGLLPRLQAKMGYFWSKGRDYLKTGFIPVTVIGFWLVTFIHTRRSTFGSTILPNAIQTGAGSQRGSFKLNLKNSACIDKHCQMFQYHPVIFMDPA